MRILALSEWFPYPPDNGARMRVHNLLGQLSGQHEIVLLTFVDGPVPSEHIAEVRTYCQRVETVPSRYYQPRRLKAFLGLFSSVPRSLVATHSPEMEALVKRTMAHEPFDVIVAFAIGPGGGTARYIKELDGTPRVIEDLETSIIKDRIAIQPDWLRRQRLCLTWWKLRRYTAQLLRAMDGCTVASAKERDLLLSISPGYDHLEVIPNGVDLARYDENFGPKETHTIVFPGALTYNANLWAMEFFLMEIFPKVRRLSPDVRLYITGGYDGVPVGEAFRQAGVTLTGYLEDVRPRIARSAVCVVPMTVGGGTRLKILEAMALGTPVVSTSKGAEGLEVTSGEDILIADDPEDFAEAVARAMDDEELCGRLIQNGRRLVREKYDWEAIGERLNHFLERVAAGREACST